MFIRDGRCESPDLGRRTSKAAPRAIQELAGHAHVTTTQRYMHLSPAAIESAIRLLERPTAEKFREKILETGEAEIVTPI
jgi:integrase